jgi:gliding motility associated protien GldN
MKLNRWILTLGVTVGMSLAAQAQVLPDGPRDEVYDKETVDKKGIIEYDHIRDSDVFFKMRVWRVIDVREKMNLPFKYPKELFVNILRDAAIEGSISVYDPIDDEFTRRLTTDEVAKIGGGEPDTVYVIDPITFEEKMEVVTKEFDATKVTKFRVKEDWIFDMETSTLVVRILGIAPITEVYDDQGNYRGDQAMFWVYYPEARTVLSQYQVFNPKNGGARSSWEDLMEMRYFASYIIKKENVYDRRIQDYLVGVDALYESDNITNEIFDFEQNLWEY